MLADTAVIGICSACDWVIDRSRGVQQPIGERAAMMDDAQSKRRASGG